jgi:hypothetical protein
MFLRLVCALFLPPLAVFLTTGLSLDFVINNHLNFNRLCPRHYPRFLDCLQRSGEFLISTPGDASFSSRCIRHLQ